MHLFNLWSESYTWMVSYRTEESCLSSIPPGPTSTINLWKGSSLYILPNHHVNYVKPWKISREALRREFKNRLQQAYFPTLILVGRSLRHYQVGGLMRAAQPLLGLGTCLPVSLPSAPPHPWAQKRPPWTSTSLCPEGLLCWATRPKLDPLRNRCFIDTIWVILLKEERRKKK